MRAHELFEDDDIEQKYSGLIASYTKEKSKFIFKGISDERNNFGDAKILFIDPFTFERKAANTHNYVNALTKELPSWQGWPPRTNSIICTGDKSHASGYGTVYQVIPTNTRTPIGICPEHYFWDSFDLLEQFGNSLKKNQFLEVSTLNIVIHNLYEYLKDPSGNVMQDLNKIEDFFKRNQNKLQSTRHQELINRFVDNGIVRTLDMLLDPKNNGFKLTTFANYTNPGDKEVWVNGPCVLIRRNN